MYQTNFEQNCKNYMEYAYKMKEPLKYEIKESNRRRKPKSYKK